MVSLCKWMAREDYEVHVYAERWDEDDQIHFHRIRTIPFAKSLRLLSFAVRASREMAEGRYDVTLGVGNTLRADVLQPHGGVHWAWFWRSLRAYNHPVLWIIKLLGRILSPGQWVSGWIEDASYGKKERPKVIAISDMVKEDMIRWYRIPEDRISVLYNGVDLARFHPRNRCYREEIRKQYGIEDELVLLFVSNNFRMKGLAFLIRALAQVKKGDHPPFKVLVLGRGREAPYRRMAKQMGISEEAVFAGSTNQPEKYYGTADLLVHPTFYDACSLTVLEALASGLPVITTSCNGASGVISHGEEGWVLGEAKDEEGLTTAIRYFFKKEKRDRALHWRERRGLACSEEANFNRLMEVFNETLRNGP